MKKLLVLTMSMMMALALTACGGSNDAGNSDGAAEAEGTINVVLEIDYPDESGVADVEDLNLEIIEGGSVLAALNAYADANNCEVLMDGESDALYISSIGGVAATETAGWTYEINDEMVMEAADQCFLKEGDEVSWSFETWGED